MVEKKVICAHLKYLLLIILFCFVQSCSDNNSYEEKFDEINKMFIEDRKELITEIIVERIEDSTFTENSVEKLNVLEKKYEHKLNELNNLFTGQEVVAPFELKKTTDIELSGYEVQVKLNIKNRTVFNVILNKIVGWLFELIILALFVIMIGVFVNYSKPFDLIKVLFSHRIIIIIFFVIGIFFSPAEYFGLIASDLENETEKIIDLNFTL